MKAKISTLENNEYSVIDNRKSKGKIDFITKVSRFNLIVKYKLFGIEKFTDAQLDKFIDCLNEAKINYKQDKINLEAKLAAEKEKYEKKTEEVASLDPKDFSEDKLDKLDTQFETVESNINAEIDEIKKLAKANREVLKEAKAEKEARIEPVNLGDYELNFPRPEEAKEDEEEDLEEKIIDETKESIENAEIANSPINVENETLDDELMKKLSDKISEMEEGKKEKPEETPVDLNIALSEELEKSMDDFNEKTINLKNEVKDSSMRVVESNIERLTTEMVVGMNKVVQDVFNEAMQVVDAKLAEFKNQLAIENEKNTNLTNELNTTKSSLDNANNTISERDREIEELKQTIAKKDEEIQKRDNTINDMTERSKGFTDEIDKLTAENTNFRTTIKTLLSSASNAMLATPNLEEEVKTR